MSMKKGIWLILLIVALVVVVGVTWKFFNRRPPTGMNMLTTTDNVQLAVQVTEPSEAPKGIFILAHALGGSKAGWNEFASAANAQGYATVTFDFRGNGDSQGDFRNFSETDFQQFPSDLKTVLEFTFTEFSRKPVILVGASIGANAAVNVAGESGLSGRVKGVVLLSVGEDYRGLQTVAAASQIHLPVLMIVSKEDDYAFQSTNALLSLLSKDTTQVIQLERAGHGTAMLRNQVDLTQQILDWSDQVLGR